MPIQRHRFCDRRWDRAGDMTERTPPHPRKIGVKTSTKEPSCDRSNPSFPPPRTTKTTRARLDELRAFLEAGLVGGAGLVERLLIGLLADGHLLVEGAPGLAKTRAAKLPARGLNVGFARIQCTPDLMPADLTGASIWRQERGVFEFSADLCSIHRFLSMKSIARRPRCNRRCSRRWRTVR